MANTLLTPTAVTREALAILHQKLPFVGAINRQYDGSFAVSGAKIGDSLKIRLPNQYTVRTGATLSTQDTSETSVTLQVATQKGVDLNFTSDDLTLDMDDFRKRILDPAVSVLAAAIESDAYSMYKDVYQMVDNDGTAITFKNIMEGRQKMVDSLTPMDGSCCAILGTDHTVDLVDALKGLFHDSAAVKQQYREGMMGRTAGYDFFESTHAGMHTTGTAVEGDSVYNVNGATESGAAVTVDGGTTTFLIGDVVTFAGVNSVHSETKADTGNLQQFVITADSGTSATSLAISPSIVVSGSTQNVSGYPTDNGIVSKIGAGASETLNTSMLFHKDAFALATADLIMPKGVDFAARENFEGISMRIVRDYDITNDKFPCRLDVLYGYKAIRPEMACRIHADG
ncbi:MAG: hypothetical protein GY938_32700 [Ketobacter sp.]|nr:hypothetical protein [Ketobacter sp.]